MNINQAKRWLCKPADHPSSLFVFCLLVAAGIAAARLQSMAQPQSAAAAPAKPVAPPEELTSLRAEIDQLKGKLPDQSHVMKDVAYHFGNLWFAAQKKNWPLADFYWSETRSHLHWAVRIIPVRKDPQGNEIRLAEILEPIEKTALEDVHHAILEKNSQRFSETYKQMLESCYACHLAAGKPFLRLQVPLQPEASVVRFEPEP